MRKNKLVLATLMASSLTLSSGAHAGFWSDVGYWIDDNIVDPIEGAVNTVAGYAEYLTVIEGTMSQQGYIESDSTPFQTPPQEAAASGVFDVLTYNVHGFPEVIGGISSSEMEQVSELIESWNVDIVGIQENWINHSQLISKLSHENYAYRSDHFAGGVLSFGDGLLTLSSYAFDSYDVDRIQFNECKGTIIELFQGKYDSPDCQTEKGFTMSKVSIARDLSVHVYNLHHNTGSDTGVNGSNMEQIAEHMNYYSSNNPIIIVGDFNMRFSNDEQRGQYEDFMEKTGVTFSCIAMDPQKDYSTCGTMIDLIGFRGSEQFELTVVNRETWEDGGISDHRPQYAEIMWSNKFYNTEHDLYDVSFKGAHNKYLVAEDNGNKEVNANRSAIGNWERFTLNLLYSQNDLSCIQSGDLVAVSTQGGYYLRASSNGNLDAKASAINSYEKFTLLNHSDGSGCLKSGDSVSLKSAHNKYVVAESNGDANANRSSVGSWERFTVTF